MMVAACAGQTVAERLPPVRGRLQFNVALAHYTWFRVGGVADAVFTPADEADLKAFLEGTPPAIPVVAIGVGSNLLIRDGGVRGVVVRLGRAFASINVEPGCRVRAGAAALDAAVARGAAEEGIAGLEFLSGIPGTIGGGLRMNAGAYGTEFKDVLISARGLDRAGHPVTFANQDMKFSYRTSDVPLDVIFVEALFQGRPEEPHLIQKRMAEIQVAREASQPIRTRTGGSTFKNPGGRRAWELIEAAGCRGLRVGDAQVSEKHCNFLINRGSARASDLETLGEEVRRRVHETSGVLLEWEIKRIGEEA